MAKRKISLKAIEGAIRSKKTPIHLREGLLKKYGHLLKEKEKNPGYIGYLVTLKRNKKALFNRGKPIPVIEFSGKGVLRKIKDLYGIEAEDVKSIKRFARGKFEEPNPKRGKRNPFSEEFLEWRRKRKHGSIMRPSTFREIEEKARKRGYRDPSAVAGRAYWKTAISKFQERKNSPPVKLYDKVLKIEAQKGKDSLYPKEKFYHTFSGGKAKAKVLGLSDGSLLIRGKRPLWRRIKQ